MGGGQFSGGSSREGVFSGRLKFYPLPVTSFPGAVA